MTTCAIIGAGLGGCALLAAMSFEGYAMRLHDLDDSRLTVIRERGGIDVDGLFQGFARAELVTAELAPAIRGANVVIVCTGSHKHAEVARLLAPASSTDRRSSSSRAAPAARSSSETSSCEAAAAPGWTCARWTTTRSRSRGRSRPR